MAGLARTGPGAGWSTAQLRRFCEHAGAAEETEHLGLVAIREAQVLAFILVTRVLDEAEVINVVVADSERRRGIGRDLLRAALTWLQGRAVHRCHLEVRVSNAAAIGLYRSEGFTENGRRKGYYRSRSGAAVEDALMMRKCIPGTGS
jgi:ribosomal-protein-alanine N-acetyltransferase